jgi:hypothetical protein
MVPAALPHAIVLGTNFGVVTSADDGQTWLWSCEQPGNAFASHYQLGAPPLNRLYATALVGSVASLVYSGDGACSWTTAGGDIASATVVDAFPDPTSAERVFALITRPTDGAMTAEAWESSDGGATFGVRRYLAASNEQLTGIESAASDPATLYLTILASAGAGVRPVLARSGDGGQTWQPHDLSDALGTSLVNLRIIAVDPSDASRVFLRVSGGSAGETVAVASGGGANLATPLSLAGGVLTAFARVPATGDLIAGGDTGGPVAFRSTDGGASFQPLPAPAHLRALAARGGRLFAVADNYADGFAVGTSDDEGMTWQPLMSYAAGGTSIAPHAIDAIAACVASTCRADCLNRAGMSQWAPDLCSAAPPDGGADAAVSPSGRESGGCRCQASGGADAPGDGAVVLVALLFVSLAGWPGHCGRGAGTWPRSRRPTRG